MAVTREQVLQALEAIMVGAETLPRSGRLSDVVVDDEARVMFSIVIQPAEAKAMEEVRQAAAAAVQRMPGVAGVFASLTADRAPAGPGSAPPAGAPHVHGGGKAAMATRGQGIPGVARVIAVASGKGGVGKSTLACNLALAFAARGLRVGILDADIYGPSMPRLLGLKGKPAVKAGILEPLVAYGLKVMSIGFLVDEDAAMIWRGPMVMSAITQMLREVAWGPLDLLVVDMPPGTGDAQLTMAQATPLAGAVIVSTPQDLALIDARRGVAMFKRVEIPILGLVENMATFVCPVCGTQSHIFGHGGARREAERLGVPFLGEIPLHMRIRETSDEGRPVMATEPGGPHALAFAAVAARLWEGLSAGPVRAPPRIVIE